MRQPGPCVRALCEAVAMLLSKNMTCARPGRNATKSEHVPHVSHCTLHTPPRTSHFTLALHQSLQKAHPSTTSYYKACTQDIPLLLCTTKLARSTSQDYFVLQSLHKARPSITLHYIALYYKASTKYVPVILCATRLAQSTSQSFFVEGSLEVKLPTIWRDEKAVSREKSQKRKDQKKEDAGARKGRKVAKHCVFMFFSWFCGSGGSKSRLAKAAGAETSGERRDEKLHAVVARSRFRSEKLQSTSAPDHFWKLRC